MSSSPFRLYECPATRSDRVKFMLEELNIPYELTTIQLAKGEHKTNEFLKINPYGAVPVLEDKNESLFLSESGAICEYIAFKHKDRLHYPTENSKEYIQYKELMYFGVSSLDPVSLTILHHSKSLAPENRSVYLLEDAIKKFTFCAQFLEKALKDNKYVLGNKISTPDFIIATTLLWVKEEVVKYPILQNYIDHILKLPSMVKVRNDVKNRL
ncbi:glutathione S-transferase family protein [Fluviispira multicolorata]|uniref:glutathione S-transferase family protein n=1 Tax=Fluviispira multicolorata TaxID=2654512 RepID=UPI0013754BF9|nr:glutathione S-transferase family protein [Fluviispira multicolorata]